METGLMFKVSDAIAEKEVVFFFGCAWMNAEQMKGNADSGGAGGGIGVLEVDRLDPGNVRASSLNRLKIDQLNTILLAITEYNV